MQFTFSMRSQHALPPLRYLVGFVFSDLSALSLSFEFPTMAMMMITIIMILLILIEHYDDRERKQPFIVNITTIEDRNVLLRQ